MLGYPSAEGVVGSRALEQVREFISSEVQPTIKVEVVAVSRMGRYSEDMLSSCRIKVEFATTVRAQAVLRAAFNLKAFNISKKKAGERPVGITCSLEMSGERRSPVL